MVSTALNRLDFIFGFPRTLVRLRGNDGWESQNWERKKWWAASRKRHGCGGITSPTVLKRAKDFSPLHWYGVLNIQSRYILLFLIHLDSIGHQHWCGRHFILHMLNLEMTS